MTMEAQPQGCKMKGVKGYCPRPLECAANFLSKKWTLSILVTIGNFGNLRFNHVLDRVEGISAKMLSDRLGELEKQKLVKRTVFLEKPPKVEYELTQRGTTLYRAIVPLMEWAEKDMCERGVKPNKDLSFLRLSKK